VVEHDHHLPLEMADLIEPLECEPARERAITDDGDDVIVLVAEIASDRDAERGGDRGRGMARVEDVVLRLFALAESGDAVVLADRMERIAAAGDQLVRI